MLSVWPKSTIFGGVFHFHDFKILKMMLQIKKIKKKLPISNVSCNVEVYTVKKQASALVSQTNIHSK